MTGTAVFLDTSILIACYIRSPELKQLIRRRLSQFDIAVTGSVAKAEFKYRFMKDVEYLHSILKAEGTFEKVRRRVSSLPAQWYRRMKICLDALDTVDEEDDSSDRTERLQRFLDYWLRRGADALVRRFVDHVLTESQCAAGLTDEIRVDRCSKSSSSCLIADFLKANAASLQKFQVALENDEETKTVVTDELQGVRRFIDELARAQKTPASLEPCRTVGDLLIALESKDIPSFYTMNYKESSFFCSQFKQVLIIRPTNRRSSDKIVDYSA